MRERRGYVFQENGKWYARVTITDETGKRRNYKRTAASKVEANKLLRELNTDLDTGKGIQPSQQKRINFEELADYYLKFHAIPARFLEGYKVEGMKGSDIVRIYVATFRKHFGKMPLSKIGYPELVEFRDTRLRTKTYKKTPRSLTTVNRELANLRRMFSVAVEQGWVERNPFRSGPGIISPSVEKRRERILLYDEEIRLLAACDTPRRRHLRLLLITLLDTGARKGELLQLKWSDIDLNSQLITIRAENSKTMKERVVGITRRLHYELSARQTEIRERSDRVFQFKSVRSVFESACKDAGIIHGGLDGLTLHCLRHTAATRLVNGQLPIQLVGRILGHTQVNTTYRYLSADTDTLKRAAEILSER